jgi:hypothetical protein
MKKLLLVLALLVPSIAHANSVKSLKIPPPCSPYAQYVEKYDWNWQTAINVMFHESTCQPNIVNLNPQTETHKSKLYRDYPSGYCVGSFGLFQTSCVDMIYYDPALNVALAYQIYKQQGWYGGWRTTCEIVKCKK